MAALEKLNLLDNITKYGGAEQRQVGLFHKEGIGKVVPVRPFNVTSI